eukprot:scaffold243116_cov35-Tisochrysis_lutea.AAC.1
MQSERLAYTLSYLFSIRSVSRLHLSLAAFWQLFAPSSPYLIGRGIGDDSVLVRVSLARRSRGAATSGSAPATTVSIAFLPSFGHQGGKAKTTEGHSCAKCEV